MILVSIKAFKTIIGDGKKYQMIKLNFDVKKHKLETG